MDAGEDDPPAPQCAPAARDDPLVRRLLEEHARSVADIRAFWEPIARREVRWLTPFTRTLDWNAPFARWFPDGRLNASDTCLDRHRGTPVWERVAYHWEGEDGARRAITYSELHRDVNRLASALRARGFGPEDVAAIYLPMIPELPVTMLALARLGVPFTSVFSGFSAAALADRMNDLGASLLITADGGRRRGKPVPLLRIAHEAVVSAPSVSTVVVAHRSGNEEPLRTPRDVAWEALLSESTGGVEPLPVESTHPLFVLYSSGTTGRPKGIVHSTGGYLVHVAATARWVFDARATDVFWCAADVGWVTGHSYIVFAPLALGWTSVLYEGAFDFPAPDRLWSIVERHRATILHTSPTALRALRKAGDEFVRAHDLSSLRLLGSVGEAINPSVWRWYHEVVGAGRCPIVDTWWQTESGGMMISPSPGLGLVPLKPGSATFPLPGIDAVVVDPQGKIAGPDEKGFLVIRQPWPGMMLGLWHDDERYRSTYWNRFPGAYYAGDYCVCDADGYLWFLGRADEVLKVAGHRLGTAEIEHALLTHPAISEAAVCGIPDALKGEVPIAFVQLRAGVAPCDRLVAELGDRVEAEIGKIARPARVHIVQMLPKTRSGKIMRRVVKAVSERRGEIGDVSTLEDEASVEEIQAALREFSNELAERPPG